MVVLPDEVYGALVALLAVTPHPDPVLVAFMDRERQRHLAAAHT